VLDSFVKKISDERLSFSPRTWRTLEALNCFDNCASTLRQLIRLPPPRRWPREASRLVRGDLDDNDERR
jgi:hypothetical protein